MDIKNDFECCPPFEPEQWDNKTLNWVDKTFVRGRVFTFFYMPVNFGAVMRKLDQKLTEAGASMQDFLCLSHHTSKWNMHVYLAVDRPIPGAENVTLTGKFFSKVYEGPFRDTGKWSRDYEETVQSKGMKVKKWLLWYTTCPKCARKYGKNYVAIISEVEDLAKKTGKYAEMH